ncbi:porin [Endobacter medicaginis]|uniref:Porin n=1 Tax=Endobacter medicaginis TaxID=1181271 RepID=A0A839US77_9PROT|nr:carbohydrate porin [Endobacter medicaginis]MBB3172617.1 porin [Endobacter medicaginis]
MSTRLVAAAALLSAGFGTAAASARSASPPPSPTSPAATAPAVPPIDTNHAWPAARPTVSRSAPDPRESHAIAQLHVLPPPETGFVPAPPTGPLAPVGIALQNHGIYLRALAVDEFAGNVSGGVRRGTGNSIATPFGADLDFNRMIGLPGAVLHISFNRSGGTSLAQAYTGNTVSFQTRYKTYQNLRLSALAWDQSLLHGAVEISGGRVSALTYFNASTLYCTFQNNAICFNPAALPIQNRSLSFFPYGTWGGRVKVNPSKRVYIQAGAFEANTSLIPTDGFDWNTHGGTGVQTAVELGIHSPSQLAPHAYNLRFGAYRNSSPVNDPYYNSRGLPKPTHNGTALIHPEGQDGWYAMGDGVLTRLGADRRRNITVFGGVIQAVPDYTLFKLQALAGLVITGPFASRPLDTFGIVGTYLQLGRNERDYLQAMRRAAQGTSRVTKGEGIFEINYGAKVMRGVTISPNIQYVLQPDNVLKPSQRSASHNILAFGFRASIELGAVAGLPVWH